MNMGSETASGHWTHPYAVQFPFVTYDARHFFFGHNINNNYWFIQELLPDGKMGDETDHGYWQRPYEAMFSFTIKGKTFCFGQNQDNCRWFIQHLKDDGTIGDETASGFWNIPYHTLVPYWIENRLFYFGQNLSRHDWFIQELLPGGKLGETTAQSGGDWGEICNVAFPFQAAAKTYILAHNTWNKHTQIKELLPGGKVGDVTDHQPWDNPYSAMFPYDIDDDQYCYGQNLNNHHWFLQELLPDGKLGQETDSGDWKFKYEVQFPFEIAGRQFFYGNSMGDSGFILKARHWFIQELLGELAVGGGKAAAAASDDWAAKVYIWSYRGLSEALGHAALELPDHTYISWWPKDMTPWSLADVADGFKKTANDGQTYEDDVRLEGFGPNFVIEIPYKSGGLNTSAIKTWWTKFKGNPDNKYRLFTQNCATTVKDALAAGGAWEILGSLEYQSFKDVYIWVPADAKNLAGRLRYKILTSSRINTNLGETEGEPPRNAPPALA